MTSNDLKWNISKKSFHAIKMKISVKGDTKLGEDYILNILKTFNDLLWPLMTSKLKFKTIRLFAYKMKAFDPDITTKHELIIDLLMTYSWFHIKGSWSVHSFNGDYLSIPEGTGRCGYLFHEIPGIIIVDETIHLTLSIKWKLVTQTSQK